MTGPPSTEAATIRQWLREADRIAVLTGSGISAESGIPTFRGDGGLWKNHRPEELATPEAFARDPQLVWEWYQWRRGLIANAQPNAGHLALRNLEGMSGTFALITQNVDGLHQRAGSHNVIELHGNIWILRCMSCGLEERSIGADVGPLPPHCACGGIQRPGVVWFGEALPQRTWLEAERASRDAQVFLTIGTAAVVYPAASLIPLAKRSGARVVEINAEPTPVSAAVDVSLIGKAGEILPGLIPAVS